MDECVKATLYWCNEQRALKGMEPLEDLPKGRRGNSDSCPCGEATNLYVLIYTFQTRAGIHAGHLPKLVTDFITKFDNGHFPEYDIDIAH